MESIHKCDNCGKLIEENNDFYMLTVKRKKGNLMIGKNFCGLKCANAWNLTHKEGKPFKETLEMEIEEAIEEEKQNVEEEEQREKLGEIKKETEHHYEKQSSNYQQDKAFQGKYISKNEYIENQEFYIKNEKDFNKVTNTMQGIKAQEPGMSRVDDSDLWEIEPETKKLKIRKMPRNVLDILKQKQIILDYYKQL